MLEKVMRIFSKRLPTIRQLQFFIAVCDDMSFRRAAERLGVSQPPLSTQIRNLEENLGTTLFLRDTHQVSLTEAGKLFELQSRKLLNTMVDNLAEIKKHSISDQGFRAGTTKTLDFNLMPKIQHMLDELSNANTIYKDTYTSKQLLMEMLNGHLDFSIVAEKPYQNELLEFKFIYKEINLITLPSSHPASKKEFVDLKDVSDLPLYWFNRLANIDYFDKCEGIFDTLPFKLTRKPEPSDPLRMLSEISLGRGMAFIPYSMCMVSRSGITYKRMTPYYEDKFKINIYLSWRKDLKKISALNAIQKILSLEP
ncbi:LysR family transcriptional regulator [Chania multitudinisentens]|nr:LysR family transcriptional regulator [Chania multitudinisentens]